VIDHTPALPGEGGGRPQAAAHQDGRGGADPPPRVTPSAAVPPASPGQAPDATRGRPGGGRWGPSPEHPALLRGRPAPPPSPPRPSFAYFYLCAGARPISGRRSPAGGGAGAARPPRGAAPPSRAAPHRAGSGTGTGTSTSAMVCGGFACSKNCLCALNLLYTSQLLEVGWNNTNSARTDIERNLNCCGFRVFDPNETCSSDCFRSHQCQPCAPIIEEYSGMVLRFVGGIGLFFSFTEILGVWLTYRYRNQKDPRANPSAFL
uniref:Tetraspanin 13 n=1 Tax=Anser cygnoides TaxID=8845 RepID=A0A8B9D128_ANSCY